MSQPPTPQQPQPPTPTAQPAPSSGAITAGQMQLVLDVSRALAVTPELDTLLKKIAEATTALLDCERASIFLYDAVTDELWTKVALQSGEIRIPSGAGIVGLAFKDKCLVHVPDPYHHPRFNPEPDRKSGFRTCNILAAPMVDIENQPVGVVQAINKCGPAGEAKDARCFTEADAAMLQLLADQAGVAIQRYRLQQAAIESMALRREMELARKVQEAMLPGKMPEVPGLEAAGWARPASINGGDCYDLWRLPDGRLAVFVADASGHGIAPALVVLQARTLVRTLSDTEPDPHKLLVRVNGRLTSDLTAGRFVTAFLGFVGSDGWMQYCSGGHGPILLRAGPGAAVQSLDASLPPLGILDDLSAEAACEPVRMEPGGCLIVTSDGITEAFSPGGELFGTDRLLETLDGVADRPAENAIAAVREAVFQWQGKKDEPNDDQTVVVVRRAPSFPRSGAHGSGGQ